MAATTLNNIDLELRGEQVTALTATQNDNNLTKLEQAVNALNAQSKTKLAAISPETSQELGWDDALASSASIGTLGAGVPATSQIGTLGQYGYEFTDEAVAGNEKRMFATIQFPHGYKQGTNVRPHLHFQIGAAIAGGDKTVQFQCDYTWTNVNAIAAANTTVTATATLTDATAAYKHFVVDLGEIVGTGKKESSVLQIVFRRLSAGATDNLAASIWLLSVDAHYQKEKGGTVNEYPT